MTKLPSASVIFSIAVTFLFRLTHAIGSGATIAVSYDSGSATVCGILASKPTQHILCYRRGSVVAVEPNVSFSSISGGRSSFCGLRSGGYSLLCWSTLRLQPKRLYYSDTVLLTSLAVGDDQICSTVAGDGTVKCWRTDETFRSTPGSDRFVSVSSGLGFSCGISSDTLRVRCWGRDPIADWIEAQFGGETMSSIAAGGSHACGLNTSGFLLCKGSNNSGQLSIPSNSSMEFSGLALGANHTCAIRRSNGSVACWGGGGAFSGEPSVSFESIVSGLNFTCGLTTSNFSILCWGPGWTGGANSGPGIELPLPAILPGPCVEPSNCGACGIYPQSELLCSSSGSICKHCEDPIQIALPTSPPPQQNPPEHVSGGLTAGLLTFAIVGAIGAISAVCTILWCLWTGICSNDKKIHNSVQPTITRTNSIAGGAASSNSQPLRSFSIRRQSSRAMRRQRSGTSSKHTERAEEFTLSDLAAATDNFSPHNKLGAGSFGTVYKGKLIDGREVAIKRGDTTNSKKKKFQDKESAFDSELAFLSRLHHKHLVRLIGFCEEKDERLLVYEYMKNGALYDHLHDKNNVEKSSSVLNSWKLRIRIALDAARGIEYLHNYAVPPIIHRDIKSSNILLDSTWTARVSDFGLSLMSGPEAGQFQPRGYRPMKAAGTVGYIDPEYYGLNVLTAKSDVYGLGVVMLELLTGKRAIFKGGGTPTSIVDYAVPAVMMGELGRVLDGRVGAVAEGSEEEEAVELVAYTAVHCVNLEGKERPTMSDIVANLETALALCDASHGSVSSGSIISMISDS